jgi:tRNA nucleotidyltransferase (CCA-adding enzyme)
MLGALEDLARRDFSVNALALSLNASGFGRLLDPWGGWRDLEARRLRPLHPLSFVEDPMRIFRAARYAARLGLRLEADRRAPRSSSCYAHRCATSSDDRCPRRSFAPSL